MTRLLRKRWAALLALAFAIDGLLGGWPQLPTWLLLLGFAWLPGYAALVPCHAACARERRVCPLEGPSSLAPALATSVLLLVPAVLPLFVLHSSLSQARWTVAATVGLVGGFAL